MRRVLTASLFMAGIGLCGERAAAAEPEDLQSSEQRDTRHSAYSLPKGMWAFDVGALGMGVGDAYAKLGAAYGLGAGLELDLNLAHWGLGLVNVSGRFHFVDTPYFDLGALVGFWYGHGEWFWIATGPAKEIISKIDVIHVPVQITASMPLERWLQFDLEVAYKHGEMFGTLSETDTLYLDAQIGVRQFALRPGVRFFLSESTEFDLSSNLPLYSGVPTERAERRAGGRVENYVTVPFSETWSMEAGFRSRFAPGLFGSVRLHYSEVARGLYGAVFIPSFNVEYRL